MLKTLRGFAVVLLVSANCAAQVYPRWFLSPVEIKCKSTAAGYARAYYNGASSDSVAYLNACKNITLAHYVKIKGGEAYWATEAGVYWMGNDITEEIDSEYFREVVSSGHKIAKFANKSITIVLAAADSCSLPSSLLKMDTCWLREPDWVESVPQGKDYIYAEGVAPRYFYESSSWESAEKRARFNLARSVNVKVQSIQKIEGRRGEDIRNEEITAEIRDIEVVYRWVDRKRGLYYVLVRMPAIGGKGE